MKVPADRVRAGGPEPGPGLGSARLDRLAAADPAGAALVGRLLGLAIAHLPRTIADGQFVFRLDGERGRDGTWTLVPAGTSIRYAAITALGLRHLPEDTQREVLGGETAGDLIGRLAGQLGEISNLGDAALVAWAVAEGRNEDLDAALRRVAELDDPQRPAPVIEAAWVVTALAAARKAADVEARLDRARARLLGARAAVYPHVIGGGQPWYRGHVGSFADQVYPLQAFARLHATADDPQALAAAEAVASAICAAQGRAGQWWWHYDSRDGSVVEGYPVYSVHQHAMGPMALLDLADAGGTDHADAISRGLSWLAGPPETTEAMILDDPPTTWRKVARADPRKAVRGARAAATAIRPGWRLGALDKIFPAGTVDHECRPYELGWLLMTWLSGT